MREERRLEQQRTGNEGALVIVPDNQLGQRLETCNTASSRRASKRLGLTLNNSPLRWRVQHNAEESASADDMKKRSSRSQRDVQSVLLIVTKRNFICLTATEITTDTNTVITALLEFGSELRDCWLIRAIGSCSAESALKCSCCSTKCRALERSSCDRWATRRCRAQSPPAVAPLTAQRHGSSVRAETFAPVAATRTEFAISAATTERMVQVLFAALPVATAKGSAFVALAPCRCLLRAQHRAAVGLNRSAAKSFCRATRFDHASSGPLAKLFGSRLRFVCAQRQSQRQFDPSART